MARDAGADLVTVHLREDRRHIQEYDLESLRQAGIKPINLELSATAEMAELAVAFAPERCCLVPERREELTTEGGLDVVANAEALGAVCAPLCEAGVHLSLFIDPDPRQVEAAAAIGIPAIELHTGRYADAGDDTARGTELKRLADAASRGVEVGLEIHAGHGLYYHNTAEVVDIAAIEELNIGHGIVARAVFVGLRQAVADMRALINEAAS